jgi:hypothetical protein
MVEGEGVSNRFGKIDFRMRLVSAIDRKLEKWHGQNFFIA